MLAPSDSVSANAAPEAAVVHTFQFMHRNIDAHVFRGTGSKVVDEVYF